MLKINHVVIAIALSLVLLFSFYSHTAQYANAVSVVTVTLAGGTTTFDVAYAKEGIFTSEADSTAYIIGANGGVAYVWKKSGSGLTENTITLNVTLTGSSSARAIEHIADTNAVFAVTNDKIYRLSSSLGISGQLATGTANIVRSLVYDNLHNNLYYCTNDGYGEINTINLSPSALYNDPQTNSVLGCAVDETNQFMYLSGDDVGASFTCEIVKISLATHTEQDCVSSTDRPFYNVCYDSSHDEVWVTASSASKVKNYDSDLNFIVDVAVGAIPRNCSISNDDGANRFYVNIESTDSVSIIDTEAHVLISTHVVCNLGVTAPKMDTKRLTNTTNTYVTCPEATNSVVIDNTVSEAPNPVGEEVCFDINSSPSVVQLLCLPDVDGDGIPDAPNSGFVFRAGKNVTAVSNDFFCSLGILADSDSDGTCDNYDVKTNGVGYVITIFLFAFMILMFAVAKIKTNLNIPEWLWIIGTFAVMGAGIGFQWIDTTLFIIGCVIVAGMASFRIYSAIQGRLGDND